MSIRNKAYVDSSAFIAFLDKSDHYNLLFNRFFSEAQSLITTPLVINETHAWFLRRYDSYKAIQFLNFIEDLSILSILSVDKELISKSVKVIRKFSDQNLTLVDASGLSLMKDKKIKICWSTDRHLTLLGSQLIINI